MRWRRARRKRASSVTKHYLEHKEAAREHVFARLQHFNQHYQLSWNRVSIRNQRRCWGSCSARKNLNFSYKLLLLPPHLCDYVVVHELCHLKELNHSERFWNLVAETLPDYKHRMRELRSIEKSGQAAVRLLKMGAAAKTAVVLAAPLER